MIEFHHVSVRFEGRGPALHAVRDAAFSIGRGEIFGIAGSSGAGKSTLLRTINCLQRISSGVVRVAGENVSSLRGKALRVHRQRIGMIFQHFNLASNLTVRQNIAFVLRSAGKGREEIDRRTAEYLSLVGLSDKADAYPATLSGGQKQRVAIARALANDAEILLCDEPTSALDVETTEAILALIQSLREKLGITVVIITHELSVIKRICDRCAVMDSGEVVELSSVYDIFASPKHPFTRQLIGHGKASDLPPAVCEHTQGTILRLTFRGERATEPVISEMTERFSVRANILAGSIEYIEGKPLGVLYVNPIGEPGAVEDAIAHLRQVVSKVEVVKA